METIKHKCSEWQVIHKSAAQGAVLIRKGDTDKVITLAEYKRATSNAGKLYDLLYNGNIILTGVAYPVCVAESNKKKASGSYNFNLFKIVNH
jgi:hypothetical protein